MEIRPLRSDEEIAEFIQKNYGSVEEYHRRHYDNPPLPKPELVQKSAAELTADRLQWLAKKEGLTLEQLLLKRPELYAEYRPLVDVR